MNESVRICHETSLDTFLAGVERRAYRMAELATGDREDALDILQDTFLTFVRSYGGRSEKEWRLLFFKVLQSRIIDWHRRTMVLHRLRIWFGWDKETVDGTDDPMAMFEDQQQPDSVEVLLHREIGQAVAKGLQSLPLRQRQAFLLRAWEGMDVAETASVMGCSEGSVKTHYSRAVHALRVLLKEYRL